MAADIVGLDLLVQEHLTHNGIEYNLFLDAGYPIGEKYLKVVLILMFLSFR